MGVVQNIILFARDVLFSQPYFMIIETGEETKADETQAAGGAREAEA